MSAFTDIALRRQTCRDFSDRPVEHEKLVRCVDAARLAPSGCNSQPWSFVVAESPDIVAEVAKTPRQLGLNAYAAGARAFVAVVEERAALLPAISCLVDGQYFAKGDLGAAVAYLCLEAEAQGLGTLQLGMFDRNPLHDLLDIPKSRPIAALVGIGYPADPVIRPKQRRSLEEVARFV